jgi:hypothetical protein
VAAQLGAQWESLALYADAGLSVGGILTDSVVDGVHDATAAGFTFAHIAPTLELEIFEHGFAAIGFLLGVGAWSHQGSRTEPTGAVKSSVTATTEGLMAFVPGLDARAGWRFGNDVDRLSVGIDFKVLSADVRQGGGALDAAGDIATHEDHGRGVLLLPMIFVGYDFKG